jgi:hypothetical protein
LGGKRSRGSRRPQYEHRLIVLSRQVEGFTADWNSARFNFNESTVGVNYYLGEPIQSNFLLNNEV